MKKLPILLILFSILLISVASADSLYYINEFDLPVTVKSIEYVDVGSVNGYVYSNATSYTCLMNHTDLTDISCNTVQQLTMSDHSLYSGIFAHVRITDSLLFSASLSGATTGSYGTATPTNAYIVFEDNGTTWTMNTTHFKEFPSGSNIALPSEMRANIEKCDYYNNNIVCLGGGDLRTIYQMDMTGVLINSFRLESSGSLKENPVDLHGTGDVLQIASSDTIYLYAISSLIEDGYTTDADFFGEQGLSSSEKILVSLIVFIVICVAGIVTGVVFDMIAIFTGLSVGGGILWLIYASVIGYLPAWILIVMFILSAGVVAIVIRNAIAGR